MVGSKYSEIRPNNYRGHEPVTGNNFNRQKDSNDNFNHMVDESLLWGNIKVITEDEAQEIIESEVDGNDIYHIDDMILDEKK